jgi:hypothetical protein
MELISTADALRGAPPHRSETLEATASGFAS